jgi:hypothetical protein
MRKLPLWPYYTTRSAQLVFIVLTLFCGAWLVAPFSALAPSPVFRKLTTLIDEDLLGSYMLCLGILKVVAFVTRHLVRTVTLLGAATWAFIGLMVYQTEPRAFSVAIFAGFTMCHFIILAGDVETRESARARTALE